MPATAGRVRMPANNRVHSSAALQTHGIWQSAIGYDPYAPTEEKKGEEKGGQAEAGASAYDSFQGLLALAKMTGSGATESRGACKKCNRVGHLTFQCRNFLSAKEEALDADNGAVKLFDANGEQLQKDDEISDVSSDSDSDLDSDLEEILAKKKKSKSSGSSRSEKKRRSKKSKKRRYLSDSSPSDSDESSDEEARKKSRKVRSQKKSSSKSSSKKYRDRKEKGYASDSESEESDDKKKHKKRSRKESDKRRHKKRK